MMCLPALASAEQPRQMGSSMASHFLAKTPDHAKNGDEEDTRSCEALIADLSLFQIESDNLQKLRKEKVAVDEALADDIRKQYNVYSVAEMKSIRMYERVLLLIARGDIRELIPLLRPYFGAVYSNVNIMYQSLQDQKLYRNDPGKRAELKTEEKKFIEAAKIFGRNYRAFIGFKRLLEKVGAGEDIEDAADAATALGKPEDQNILLNLRRDRARIAAKRALEILTSPTEQQWLISSSRVVRSDKFVSTMYMHSMDAKLASQKAELEEQRKSRSLFLKGVQHLANLYLNLTDRSFIPERYRKWILRLNGVAYNSLMLDRYLDKIQAVIDVTRLESPSGNIVLASDEESLELQLQTLREFRATGIGEDFLVTFARLGWRTREWVNLKRYVEYKAQITKSDTNSYVALAAAMDLAEKKKDEIGELPFTYEPAARHELIFVGMQIAWLVGQEEFWRHWGASWIHQTANYFF
jgi:hypothetical protein